MEIMAIKLSDHIIIKRGSRPNPLSKYEIYDLNSNNNAIPYPIQSDINKNSLMLNKYKKMFKINLGFKFEPAIKGDLLLSSSCDIGNAVILDLEKAFIDDKFFNVKTSPNLSKKYLQYWLLKNKKEISELGHGTTFKVLYLEPFKKYIDKIFLPNLDEQQQIINIIEPNEKLFLKYNKIIDISNLDNFKKSWNNLINIIEPFERLKIYISNFIDKIEILFLKIGETSKILGKMKDFNIKFEKGMNINSKFISNQKSNILFINVSAINNKFNKWLIKNDIKENVEYGDIILSLDGTIGIVNNFLKGFNGYGYKISSTNIDNSIIYCSLIDRRNKQIMIENSTGSVIKHSLNSKNELVLLDIKKEEINKLFKLQITYKKWLISLNKIIKKLIEIYIY